MKHKDEKPFGFYMAKNMAICIIRGDYYWYRVPKPLRPMVQRFLEVNGFQHLIKED